jgi:aspartyl-tRNA(Asn)/glutamyl-tRNA(Gln) amidotransferase subunit C
MSAMANLPAGKVKRKPARAGKESPPFAPALFSALHFGDPLSTLPGMSDFNVKYVAHLARLSLTPEEEQKFGAQLGQVLGYIEKLKEVDVSQVEPTAHAVPLVNVTRPDVVRPSLPTEDALRNAPMKSNGLFVVPKIVE